MSVIRHIVRFAAPLALLTATGCAENFDAQVNRFQAMPAVQGQSFYVKPVDPKLIGGLEFATYASQVSQRLQALGYQAATSPESAALVVSLSYGVDGGKDRVRSVPSAYSGSCWGSYDPWCNRFGYYPVSWRGGRYGSGFYDPFLFGAGYGYGNEVENYTVYTSDLSMQIAKQGSGERVFEGSAKAMSLNNNLTYLVPNLIQAMFTGFPGNSGETVKITVPPPPKAR
ncbi:MAG: hypothetical protein RL367_365 [Pseudomonadota bacterium]|jgi:hypothetical protein